MGNCHYLQATTILYVENPKVATQRLLELINEFSELQDIRLIYRNLLYFITLTMKYQKESKNNISN